MKQKSNVFMAEEKISVLMRKFADAVHYFASGGGAL